jgi:lipopolysaccharide/colanic/teichoic acid biosynthesis glycosyltransferase
MSVIAQSSPLAFRPSGNWNSGWQVFCKRAIDVSLSGILLTLLAPLLAILAIVVKSTSPGPVFYPWRVVGKNGRPFVGYKFRSMVDGADSLKAELEARNEMQGPVFKLTDDPRITPVGHWLRQYSLDELPQLYSVLTGDMSLVGPRPPLVTEYARFTEWQKQKLAVVPGMTCFWQVNGRNAVQNFDEWVRLDLEYISRWSLWLDLRILWRTLGVVVRGSGK